MFNGEISTKINVECTAASGGMVSGIAETGMDY